MKRPGLCCRVSGVRMLLVFGLLLGGGVCRGEGQGAGSGTAAGELRGDRVTINVEEGNLTQVLNAFSRQTGRSIVVGPDVAGKVTVRLNNIPWQEALDMILGPHGYGYTETNSTIVVGKVTRPASPKGGDAPVVAPSPVVAPAVLPTEPVISRVIILKFLDVSDVEDVVKAHLSPAGKMGKLAVRGQSWEMESGFGWSQGVGSGGAGGATGMGRLRRIAESRDLVKSKTMIVSDTEAVINRVQQILAEVDKRPVQVLIETRFVEVDADRLRDIGVEFGTGANGAQNPGIQPQAVNRNSDTFGLGAQSLGGTLTPSAFNSKTLSLADRRPFNAGLSLAFQKLDDFQFEVLLHMLEEDVSGKLLSAPRILTVNNQDATIIVGEKFPIIKSDSTSAAGAGQVVSTSLDYYENIGIQLKVLPQICDGDYINLIIHPSVRNRIGTESGITGSGSDSVALTRYPVLSTREAETEIVLRSGQTVVIGGLLDERKYVSQYKVPFLGNIPLLGLLFRRETVSTRKVDLLIFLTATVKSPDESAEAPAVSVLSGAAAVSATGEAPKAP